MQTEFILAGVIGLAIVKAVVGIHQGKIEVKNREVKGTEFSLILPI